MKNPIALLLVVGGVAVVGYGFFNERSLKPGEKVAVNINSVQTNPPLPVKLDVDLLIEVLSVAKDTVTGRVLGRADDVPFPDARVGLSVTFPKSAVKRKVS